MAAGGIELLFLEFPEIFLRSTTFLNSSSICSVLCTCTRATIIFEETQNISEYLTPAVGFQFGSSLPIAPWKCREYHIAPFTLEAIGTPDAGILQFLWSLKSWEAMRRRLPRPDVSSNMFLTKPWWCVHIVPDGVNELTSSYLHHFRVLHGLRKLGFASSRSKLLSIAKLDMDNKSCAEIIDEADSVAMAARFLSEDVMCVESYNFKNATLDRRTGGRVELTIVLSAWPRHLAGDSIRIHFHSFLQWYTCSNPI
jgi:hypothetical protein